jgi:hypothetical protein
LHLTPEHAQPPRGFMNSVWKTKSDGQSRRAAQRRHTQRSAVQENAADCASIEITETDGVVCLFFCCATILCSQ